MIFKHRGYLALGLVFILASLPGWVQAARGTLIQTRNPYLLFSLFGVILGGMYLLYAMERPRPNGKSWTAVRIGWIAVFFIGVMLLMLAGARVAEPLMTGARFSVTAAAYLSTLALAFLVLGLFRRDPPPSTHYPREPEA